MTEAFEEMRRNFNALGRQIAKSLEPGLLRLAKVFSVQRCDHVPYLYVSGYDITAYCSRCGMTL